MPEYIKKLLKSIKDCPAAYIGKKSLDRLSHFIAGYMCCIYESSSSWQESFPGFQEFVAKHYNVESMHHWSSIISFYSTYEEEAFDEFYNLLYEFYGKWDDFY